MKVRELINILNKIENKEQTVYLSVDEEGSYYTIAECIIESKKEDGRLIGNFEPIIGVIIYPRD